MSKPEEVFTTSTFDEDFTNSEGGIGTVVGKENGLTFTPIVLSARTKNKKRKRAETSKLRTTSSFRSNY